MIFAKKWRMKSGQNIENSQPSRLPSFQLLRCMACIMVFGVHFRQLVGLSGILRKITDIGVMGPHLFFILSEFLAAKSLCRNKSGIWKYYKKCALTILSLYYAIMLWLFSSDSLLAYRYQFKIPVDEYHLGWFRYLFLLNGIMDSSSTYWTNLAGTWTIPIFALFYIISPFAMPRIRTSGQAVLTWGGYLQFPLC